MARRVFVSFRSPVGCEALRICSTLYIYVRAVAKKKKKSCFVGDCFVLSRLFLSVIGETPSRQATWCTRKTQRSRPGDVNTAVFGLRLDALVRTPRVFYVQVYAPFLSFFLSAAWCQIFTYPVEMYVARHVLDVSVFQTLLGMGPPSTSRHYCVTVGIWALTMLVALSTNNLGSILEIFGSFGASVSFSSFFSSFFSYICSLVFFVWVGWLPRAFREWMGLFDLSV